MSGPITSWQIDGENMEIASCFLFLGSKINVDSDCSPPQCSRLENPMDRGAWWAVVNGVDESQTRLSNFTFTFHFHALEKEMAAQCSCLENPRDGGAWWAAIYGVTQSQTRLK